jgi:hypothetical protein
LIGNVAIAVCRESLGGRPCEPGPFMRKHMADFYRARIAVQKTEIVEVGLELSEVRKNVVPGPTCSTHRHPFVVVVRGAAIGERAIDA